MTVRIKNLVMSAPIVVPLSSGRTVRLSPGQVSDEMPDVEVVDNAKVDKLRRQRLIDIESTDAAEGDAEPPPDAEPASPPARASRSKRTDSSK